MFPFSAYELFARNLGDRADHVAVVDGDREETYAQLETRISRMAAWLTQSGVNRGDRVAIHLQKSIDQVVAIFATARVGAVFVNLYRQWTLAQLDYVIGDCGATVLVTDARRAKELDQHAVPQPVTHVLVRGKTPEHPQMTPWEGLADYSVAPVRVIDTDLAAILYTSGSTGQPKGVMITHLNLVQGARSVATYLNNRPEDRILGLLEFCFDYGLNQLMTMCLVGGTLVLHNVIMPVEILKTLREKRVTGFAGVAPAWIDLVRFLQQSPIELPQLRYITNSGGSIPMPVLEAMPHVFPEVDVYLMYGLTEAFRSTYVPPDMFASKMGAMGIDVPDVETFVVDPKIGICGPGQQGELVHRGSLVSRGYWGNPEATAAKIKPCPQLKHVIGDEKVCYSGDIIRIDEDGYYWFVSRMDSMIKCNSIRISPTEVEEMLHQSGLVERAVAFGVDDEALGQVVHVVIQPSGPATDEESLGEYCRRNMPPYMVPRKFHLCADPMPRTASGKIDRTKVIRDAQPS